MRLCSEEQLLALVQQFDLPPSDGLCYLHRLLCLGESEREISAALGVPIGEVRGELALVRAEMERNARRNKDLEYWREILSVFASRQHRDHGPLQGRNRYTAEPQEVQVRGQIVTPHDMLRCHRGTWEWK